MIELSAVGDAQVCIRFIPMLDKNHARKVADQAIDVLKVAKLPITKVVGLYPAIGKICFQFSGIYTSDALFKLAEDTIDALRNAKLPVIRVLWNSIYLWSER